VNKETNPYSSYLNDSKDDEQEGFGQSFFSKETKGVDGVVKAIHILLQDKLMPKSVVTKLSMIASILNKDKEETQLKINKAQDILNEITEDSNLPSFIKTQIWHLAEMLERIK
jgi:uncharacterized protein (UPF0147 family)